MKNVIRAFALSLVATGAFASAHLTSNDKTIVQPTQAGAMPPAYCPWNDPNACGIGSGN